MISFYDTFQGVKALIGNFTLPAIRSGQTGVALATWQHMLPGDHNITVVIDEKNLLLESSKDNNLASLMVMYWAIQIWWRRACSSSCPIPW